MFPFFVAAAIASIVATMSPSLRLLLGYDRAQVMDGEVWRLVTCHLVHFSPSHLFWDLCGLFLSAWFLSRKSYCDGGSVVVTAVIAIGGAIFFVDPEMTSYGGLSGIVTALIVFTALVGSLEQEREKWWWRLALVFFCGKTAYELATAHPTLVSFGDVTFVPAIHVHVAGALAGAVCASISILSSRITLGQRL